MRDLIQGAGGGGDEGRTPVEAPDSLRSTQVARIIDIVSEGEIVGLKHALRSVFLNETPVQNTDGSFNFKNVSVQQRLGTVDQSEIESSSGTEFEIGVSAEVKADVPITRTLPSNSASLVRVTLGFPQLTSQNLENGDLNGSEVSFKIQVQSNGAGFVDKVVHTLRGKTTSRYQSAFVIALDGSGPWDIKVVRVSPDSTSSAIENRMFFDSMTGIIPSRLAYPNSALIGLSIDAANFTSIPNRAYLIRGLIVKVPTNYDPTTRAYTGVWDGTFKNAWTDNPAWCFYDLVLNERYGLGQFVDTSAIDKWSLYAIGRYCDQMVPNGRGQMEPRFTCNLYLQTREDAFKVLQNFASIFRAITYWAGGAVVTSQDRPSDPVTQFNNTSVEDGLFRYSGTSLKQRHTVALVGWNDPNDFYRQKVEYVQDDELVQRFGILETEVSAFGCSSQAQAHRLGRWMLATERYSNETISFKAGLDSLNLYPGAVLQTSDQHRAGKRMGGRVLASTTSNGVTKLTLDADSAMQAGHSYTLTVVLPSGAMETRTLSTITEEDGTLVIPQPAFSSDIEPGTPYILTDTNTILPELWRTLSISEASPGTAEVTALAYIPDLYDNVEQGFSIDPRPTSAVSTRPQTPSSLRVVPFHYRVDGQIAGLRALVSWVSNEPRFRVSWRKASGQWMSRDGVTDTSFEIDSVDAAVYTVTVVAMNSSGRESQAATVTVDLAAGVEEALDKLPAPQNLRLSSPYLRGDANFAWDAVKGAIGYDIEISRNASPFAAVRTVNVGNVLRYQYLPQDMAEDGGPFRSITIRVRAYAVYNKKGNWKTLTVGNPQVGALSGVSITPGISSIFFQCAQPSDADFAGILIWVGTTPDFVPGPSNLVFDGPTTFAVLATDASGDPYDDKQPYYLRAAGYDELGKDGLNISGSYAINVYNKAPGKDEIIADMIKDGALTHTKFADGLEPVAIVDALPVLPGVPPYTGSKTVMFGGKLYFLINGAWQVNIATPANGSVGEIQLDPGLTTRIDKIDGPDSTPGTIANTLANAIAGVNNLTDEKLEYVGSLSQTAIAAAKMAMKAQSTGQQASVVYTNTIAAKLGNDITAAVYAESQVRVTALQSLAQTVNGLSVTWTQDINAAITEFNQTVASANYASATSVSELSATVGENTTTLQQTATVTAGLKSRVETKIDANGVITGYALDVDTPRTGPATSTMTFAVSAFRIQGTGTSATAPFEVDTTTNTVKMSGVHIKNGTLSGDKIVANSITTGQIAVGAIKAEQIAAGAITTDAITIGTQGGIPGTFIKDGTVASEKIKAATITGDKIVANTITGSLIAATTITGDKIEAATITANHIDSRGLSIQDAAGNTILSAGTALDWSRIGGANKPADNANYTTNTNQLTDGAGLGTTADWNNIYNMLSNVAALSSTDKIKNSLITVNADGSLTNAGTGKVSLSGIGYYGDPNATSNTGPFAMLNGKITAGIAASYFEANSINGTYIANLAADKILAGTLGASVIYAGTIAADKISAGSLATNVLYTGTLSADQINTGYLSADRIRGGSGNFKILSDNSVTIFGVTLTNGTAYSSLSPGNPAFSATGSSSYSSNPAITANGQSSNALNITGGANGVVQSGGGANWFFGINPASDNAYSMGGAGYRYNVIYAASGVINTSDIRLKKDIEDSDLGLDFIKKLRVIKYRMIEGRKQVDTAPFVGPVPEGEVAPDNVKLETSIPGVRIHYGLPAQNVRQAMLDCGVTDAAFWSLDNPDDPDSRQGLRYEEITGGPLIRAVQQLSDALDIALARIAELEARLPQ